MGTTWTRTETEAGPALRVDNKLHWAMYDRDGLRIAQGSDFSCTPTPEELAQWDAYAPALTPRAFAVPVEFYVRFFRLPKGGRSKNHNDGHREAGVSVYGPCWYDAAANQIRGLSVQASVLIAAESPAWIVTGDLVGYGSDDEPLIRNVTVLNPIAFDGYTARPVLA